MKESSSYVLRIWFRESRPHFLLLSVILVSLGTSVAWYEGFFDPINFLLALAGTVLVHMSSGLLNDYFDYESGLDLETEKTPFSGGSGILPAGLLRPEAVFRVGVAALILGILIGVYFTITKGWLLLPILIIGGASAYFYSTHLSKWLVGEFFIGLNFGPLAILGAYFVQTGNFSWGVLATSLAPGILVGNLLFLNEIPDAAADEKVGRRNLVTILGKRQASRLFVGLLGVAYLCIVCGVISRLMPFPVLSSLAALPLGLKAAKGALENFDDVKKLIPAMGANAGTVLITQALIVLGYILARLTQ